MAGPWLYPALPNLKDYHTHLLPPAVCENVVQSLAHDAGLSRWYCQSGCEIPKLAPLCTLLQNLKLL